MQTADRKRARRVQCGSPYGRIIAGTRYSGPRKVESGSESTSPTFWIKDKYAYDCLSARHIDINWFDQNTNKKYKCVVLFCQLCVCVCARMHSSQILYIYISFNIRVFMRVWLPLTITTNIPTCIAFSFAANALMSSSSQTAREQYSGTAWNWTVEGKRSERKCEGKKGWGREDVREKQLEYFCNTNERECALSNAINVPK